MAGACFLASPRRISANDRLDVGIIGVGNRGEENFADIRTENIVALCDVDDNFLAAATRKFPKATKYNDFRRLLERKDLDAVVISTPDHTHAVIAVAALKRDLHVYCEKPLARTISETRTVAETARGRRLATQLGTQIHAGASYRRVVELIQANTIGAIHEVHVWVKGSLGNKERPTDTPPIPRHLHYDLWLGPVPYRPYHPSHVPYEWRHWWDFAGGTLADLGCHHMDLSHWALGLRYPETVEAEGPPVHPDSVPHWLIVRYEYPARGEQPPVSLTWYHGGRRPPQFADGRLPEWGDGTLFVGDKGMLLAGYYSHVLLPQKDFANLQPAQPLSRDISAHYREWIEACKTGSSTSCAFEYGGALTETVLLGNVAFRSGQKLVWNPQKMQATNILKQTNISSIAIETAGRCSRFSPRRGDGEEGL